MTSTSLVVVIVAAADGGGDVASSLNGFVREITGRGRVLLVDGTTNRLAAETARSLGVDVLEALPGSLVPDLWGLGVRATSEPLVALSTSGMVPLEGWLDAMLDALERSQAAAVGGPIEPEEELSSLDRAVFFLRYLNYVRPIPEPGTIEPPGDNALYRRDALPPIDGFWESRVHRILRERGERVVFEPEAVVTFHGSSRRRRQPAQEARASVITNEWSLLNQRFLHAWNYGSDRSRRLGWRWALARTILAPLVPLALLSRIGRNLASKNIRPRHWLPALPFLLPLLAAWCWGEVVGYWLKPPRLRHLLSRSRASASSNGRRELMTAGSHQSFD
jgi:hypothetical protein